MTDWTQDRLDALLRGFLDHSLPAAEWTHHAHLLVGTMLARRLPEAELLPFLRDAIGRYNIATGNRNTETTGYHEAITAFYAAALAAFARLTADMPMPQVAARLLDGPLAERGIVERAYRPATLKTVEARLKGALFDQDAFDAEVLAAEALSGSTDFTVRLARGPRKSGQSKGPA